MMIKLVALFAVICAATALNDRYNKTQTNLENLLSGCQQGPLKDIPQECQKFNHNAGGFPTNNFPAMFNRALRTCHFKSLGYFNEQNKLDEAAVIKSFEPFIKNKQLTASVNEAISKCVKTANSKVDGGESEYVDAGEVAKELMSCWIVDHVFQNVFPSALCPQTA